MDIFKDPTSKVPTKSGNIIRVDMEQLDVGGRKSHLPKTEMSPMSISHVSNVAKGGS
jgi:hypothetical protein